MLLLSVFLLMLALPAGLAEGGQISGLVWQEKTVDGLLTGGEGGVNGVRITLEKKDETGAVRRLASTATDKAGSFVLPSLAAGTYRLNVEADNSFRMTLHGLDSAALPAQGSVGYTPWFTLGEGEALQKNIGLTKTQCSVSLIAFEDSNANGGRMQTEPLVRGMQAEIIYEYEGETYVVAADMTDKDGQALMRELSPGTYRVRVTLPGHYVAGPLGQKINAFYNCVLPNADNTGLTAPFTLAAKESVSMGVGMVRTGSLEGKIWFDANNNGKWDKEEAGLTDAVITLQSPALGLDRTTQADGRGVYVFQGLQPGDYLLKFQLPEGMVFTYPGTSLLSAISDSASLSVSVQVDVTTSLNAVGAMPAAELSLTLVSEDGTLPGATVTAVQGGKTVATAQTDENGAAVFHALRAGETVLKVTLPEGWLFVPSEDALFPVTGAQGQAEVTLTLDGTEPDAACSAAVTPAASISGLLFEDADNSGLFREDSVLLAGYTVQAVNEAGEAAAEAVTGADGSYTLSPLLGGSYTVRFLLDDTYVASPYAVGQGERVNHIQAQTPEYGETEALDIQPGQALERVDGSVFRAGAVEGFVYLDEAYAPAQTGMAGVTVTLLSEDGAPVSDYSYGVTDDSGAFLIKGVLPGVYTLDYALPDNGQWVDPAMQDHHWRSEAVTTESGSQIQMPPLYGMVTSTVAGTVLHDPDVAGDFSALVSLKGHTVSVVHEVHTDSDGAFAFRDLLPDTYTLTVVLPQNMVFGELEGALIPPTAGSRASAEIVLGLGENRADIRVRSAVSVAVFGVIFVDSNLSYMQDEDEYGAEGLTVSLWENGEQIQTFTTDDSGSFYFGRLIPGAYDMHLALDENERPMEDTGVERGDGDWVLPLILEENTPKVLPILRLGSAEGQVWSMDGSVNGVSGIAVSLVNDEGEKTETVLTDDRGAYAFHALMPGDYRLSADLPQGYLFARGQDTADRDSYIQSLPDGSLDVLPFFIAMGDDLSGIDLGIGANGSIGDRAWLDLNGNGMQDTGEPNMPGIEISLYQYGALIASTVTDVYGRYALTDLYPGEYEMTVVMPKEIKATVYQTEFPLVGSILPESEETTVTASQVTVPSGGENLHCDLGFQLRKKNVYPAVMDTIPTKDWRPYSER